MNDPKWDEVEKKILEACQRGKEAGIGLVYGTFGRYEPGNRCCALSMVVGKKDHGGDPVTTAAEILGIAYAEAWGIVHGFDLSIGDGRPRNHSAYQLGASLREKLQPKPNLWR